MVVFKFAPLILLSVRSFKYGALITLEIVLHKGMADEISFGVCSVRLCVVRNSIIVLSFINIQLLSSFIYIYRTYPIVTTLQCQMFDEYSMVCQTDKETTTSIEAQA